MPDEKRIRLVRDGVAVELQDLEGLVRFGAIDFVVEVVEEGQSGHEAWSAGVRLIEDAIGVRPHEDATVSQLAQGGQSPLLVRQGTTFTMSSFLWRERVRLVKARRRAARNQWGDPKTSFFVNVEEEGEPLVAPDTYRRTKKRSDRRPRLPAELARNTIRVSRPFLIQYARVPTPLDSTDALLVIHVQDRQSRGRTLQMKEAAKLLSCSDRAIRDRFRRLEERGSVTRVAQPGKPSCFDFQPLFERMQADTKEQRPHPGRRWAARVWPSHLARAWTDIPRVLLLKGWQAPTPLLPHHQMLLIHLLEHRWQPRHYQIGMGRLAGRMGLSVRRTREIARQLSEMGLIHRTRLPRSTNWWLLEPLLEVLVSWS